MLVYFSTGLDNADDGFGVHMMHAQFLRIKKLTGKTIIEVAARHNCREIPAELGAVQGGRINPPLSD